MNITINHTTSCDRCGRPCDSYIMIMDKRICGICQWEQMQPFPIKEQTFHVHTSLIPEPPFVPTDEKIEKWVNENFINDTISISQKDIVKILSMFVRDLLTKKEEK